MVLLCAVLLPAAAGIGVRLLGNGREKAAKALAFTGTAVTSVLVLLTAILGSDSLVLLTFTDALRLSLGADGASRFFSSLVAILWPFATAYAFVYMKHHDNRVTYFSYYLMTYGAVLGIAFAENSLTMYVFYEALTFLSLPLILHTQTKEARKAGRVYLYYSLSGSSLALAGIIIVSVVTGTSDFVRGGVLTTYDGMAGFAYLLTFFGFGVKAAVFPLCRWLPMASAAPTPTTALLHAVAVVKSGAFAVIRMTYYFFSPEALSGTAAQTVALAVAAATVVYGSSMALREMHFKRRFAYSTVANLSYILFGALLCTPSGLSAGLLHFVMHSVTKIAVFFCVGAVMETTGARYLCELNGMGRKMPVAFTLYALAGFSLIGIPPFGGFVSKVALVRAGMEAGSAGAWIGVCAIILSAVLTAAYVMTVLVRACFREPLSEHRAAYDKATELPVGFLVIIGVFAVLSLLCGLFGARIEGLISLWIGGGV